MATTINAPESKKESQKPADKTAHGSMATIKAAAKDNTATGDAKPPCKIAKAATASIKKLRLTGTAKPASKAYPKAAGTAAIKAAFWAGIRLIRAALRRHKKAVSKAINPAAKEMCIPDTLTK